MTAVVVCMPDSFAYLATLGHGEVDVTLTDPPYPEGVQSNLCSGSLVGTKSVPKYSLEFASLTAQQRTGWLTDALRATKRWVVSFCALEDFGRMQDTFGKQYVRGGVWAKSNCLPGRTMLYARTDSGDGPAKLEHLVRLPPEKVQLWDGEKWTRVTAWTKSPSSKTLKMTLRSGEVLTCTHGHVWPTTQGNFASRDLSVGDVIRTCLLPEPPARPSIFDSEEMGWFVGTYLADGSIADGMLQIASNKNEWVRFARLQTLAKEWGTSCNVFDTTENGCTANIYSPILVEVIRRFLGGNNAHNKRVLHTTWRSSNAFLRGVWSGYLAGDGGWDKKAHVWRLGFCRNARLAQDLRTLGARLGWDVRLRPKYAMCEGKKFGTFKGYARERPSDHPNAKPRGEIVKITAGATGTCWDVTVADAPNLFALSSGVLTHNSMGQLTGDRPATAYEGVGILHRLNLKKRWNGRGSYGIWRTEHDVGDPAIWSCNGTRGLKGRHPNEKPIALLLKLVALFSERGETVFDPFCGSGAVGEACVRLGRNYVGLDSDPAWADKARARVARTDLAPVTDAEALAMCATWGKAPPAVR